MAEAGFDRFKYSQRGYIEVLKSDGVRAHLQLLADGVKRSADADLARAGAGDIELIADTSTGRTRVGATVIGVPMRIEARERILGRALGGA